MRALQGKVSVHLHDDTTTAHPAAHLTAGVQTICTGLIKIEAQNQQQIRHNYIYKDIYTWVTAQLFLFNRAVTLSTVYSMMPFAGAALARQGLKPL